MSFRGLLIPLLLLFLCLTIGNLHQGCAIEEDDDDDDSQGVIWPLALGNTWNYLVQQSGVTVGTRTSSVVASGVINNQPVFKIENSQTSKSKKYHPFIDLLRSTPLFTSPHLKTAYQQENSKLFWKNHSNGLYEYGEGEGDQYEVHDQPMLVFKYPVTDGENFADGWENPVSVNSIATTVSVPAGSFECLLYHIIDNVSGITYDYYLKPDLGMVKSVVAFNGFSGEIMLENYTLN